MSTWEALDKALKKEEKCGKIQVLKRFIEGDKIDRTIKKWFRNKIQRYI